jgi:hypothetical protein
MEREGDGKEGVEVEGVEGVGQGEEEEEAELELVLWRELSSNSLWLEEDERKILIFGNAHSFGFHQQRRKPLRRSRVA